MVIYEAVTLRHLRKIVDFLLQQPSESLVLKCWQHGLTIEQLKSLKQNPYLDIYVVEDDQGNIRLVWGRERRGFSGLNEPKVSVNAFMCMKHEDFEAGNYTYLKEFFKWAVQEDIKLGLTGLEIWGLERFVLWAKGFLGDVITVQRTMELPVVGKVYSVYVDLNKAALRLR